MCTCLHLEATLLDVRSAFDAQGIETLVLKGPAAAHLDYADPTLRSFGDLDLMVRSEQVDRATTQLREMGFSRAAPEPRDGFDRRFGKGAEFVAADGINVDLHRTFVMGPFGLRVRLDELWASTTSFNLGGHAILSLSPVHRLLAACYNAIVGDVSPRLSTLRDVAQLCLSGEVDTQEVVDTARRWGGESVLALGVRAAWERLAIADVVGLSAWAARVEGDSSDLRLLALYHDRRAGYSGLSWATARMLPLGERIAFLGSLAFPHGGRLGERQWGLGQRVRRAVRGLGRTVP
jgi:hypothetical protein